MKHQYTKSQNVEAVSLFNQKKKERIDEKPDRKHLLALLCSYTKQEIGVRSQQVQEQLCCFDRMKKLICNQDIPSAVAQKDQVNSIIIEQKINQMELRMNKKATSAISLKTHKKSQTSHNFLRRSCIVQDLKNDCMQKYINHQVFKKDKEAGEVRKFIEKEVLLKVDQIVQDRGLQFIKLKEDYEKLKKGLLDKTLEIEGLKIRQIQMKLYINQLQQLSKCRKQAKKEPQGKQEYQTFQQKFKQAFGQCTIQQLKTRLQIAISKCLDGFQKVENRNQIKLQDLRKTFEQKQTRLKTRINQLQNSENELMYNIRTMKINKHLSEIEVDGLLKAKAELQALQKLILSLYTQWHQQRIQNEKKVLNVIGCLDQNYSYEQMLKYITQYGKKFSSHDKLNDYLFKVLRGIQKLRRIIWPQKCNQKLDPLVTIDSIEKWIKLRVSVPQYSKKAVVANEENYFDQL